MMEAHGASDNELGKDGPQSEPNLDDDTPESDPEFDAALEHQRASFAQWASCWFFSQRAFNEREQSRHRYERYRDRMFQAFEEGHGEVVDSYYCQNVAAAAALTRTRERKWAMRGDKTEERLHLHVMDNLPDGADRDADAAAASDLLSQCDDLANKAEEDLTGQERYRCTEAIYGSVTDLLDILDEAAIRLNPERYAKEGTEPSHPLRRESRLVVLARKGLGETAKYYDRMAQRRAQFVYFAGMLIGVAVIVLLAAFGWRTIGTQHRALVEGCVAAGAVGALMSVLSRVTFGRFRVAYDVGRRYILLSGSSRPVVGAVFGLLFYFAVQGGWIPLQAPTDSDSRFAFFAVGAFVAGYGERLAQDLLTEARGRLAPAVVTPPPRATAAPDEPEAPTDA